MTTDLSRKELRPYFLWDEDLSIAEFEERLAGDDHDEKVRLLTKLLREARDIDVWCFTTPDAVSKQFAEIAPRLGRRRSFWEFLIEGWRDDGIIDDKS